MPRICNYEGSQYRVDFWGGQHREYEDRVERIAMQNLLPPKGKRLIEVGAGFGRLVDLYNGYDQIILTDYAHTQLEEAKNCAGNDDRFMYVVADVYKMPFVDNLFDTLTMVRVMHHLADVSAALAELHRILLPDGIAVIEHASKLHLKSLIRWLLRRQDWSPLNYTPVEFVELNFDFHPVWMRRQLEAAGFCIKNTRTVSHFRLNLLKRLMPTSWLVTLDSWLQPTGNRWQLTPSLFLQAQVQKPATLPPSGFFRCPVCHSTDFFPKNSSSQMIEGELLVCSGCRRCWSFKDGIYDFKTPLGLAR